MSRNVIANWFFDPIVSVGFPMPKIAFLPVVILWLGVYDVSKITIIVIDAIFPVIAATVIAIQGVERELIWSARNMGANNRELLYQIILPAALAADHDRTAGRAAAVADRRSRSGDADGRLRPRRRNDNGFAFCQFHKRFCRYLEIAVVGYVLVKVMSLDPAPPADLAPGSKRAHHGLSVPDGGAFAARGRLAKISWTPDNLHLRNEKLCQ